MPTKTIAYLRVSTDKQADRGVRLDVQRAKLKAYAELYELDLVEIIVHAGQSAKSLDRLTTAAVNRGSGTSASAPVSPPVTTAAVPAGACARS